MTRAEAGASVLFRVDGSAKAGGGHVSRCLALADALSAAGARCTFACAELPASFDERIAASGHELRMIDRVIGHANDIFRPEIAPPEAQQRDAALSLAACETRPDWVVADHYRLDRSWEAAARADGAKLLVIDDLADRPHECDMLVDQSLGRSGGDYAGLVPAGCVTLLGPGYALLRPEFAVARPAALERRKAAEAPRRLLVSLGATDVGGVTAEAAQAALKARHALAIDVVLGSAAPSLSQLRSLAEREPRLTLHVDSGAIAELMVAADLAVGAAGVSSWERCCLALPAICLVLADNQRFVIEQLAEAGAALRAERIDDLPALIDALAGDEVRLAALAAAAAAITDGRGADAVAARMLGVGQAGGEIRLREARREDAGDLWLWRNDPATKAASQTRAPIAWQDHLRWFEGALGSPAQRLFIAENDGGPIGVVRFSRVGDEGWEVSINVRPAARARGIGGAMLRAACEAFGAERREPLIATIASTNAASRRIFEAQGFRFDRPLGDSGFDRYLKPEVGAGAPQRPERT